MMRLVVVSPGAAVRQIDEGADERRVIEREDEKHVDVDTGIIK